MTRIRQLVAAERRGQRGRLAIAGFSASVLSIASVLLLGLSGWFIAGAAMAGLGAAAERRD
jgi:ATP-binding cassette subfamily C protein CydC